MDKKSGIYVAGHTGLAGSAIVRKLKEQGYDNLVLRTHAELDLKNQDAVSRFFAETKPEFVFMAAGKVGGIQANSTYPAEFIYDNLLMVTNVVHNSYAAGVKKLLFLGSSCIYPRLCPQPIKEEYLLTGPLEGTNYAYAVSKIAGVKMCQAYHKQYGCDFISAMPANLYGPGDKYDLENAHVLPALIRKFCEGRRNNSKEVVLWGTGSAKREFLYSGDLAEAVIFLMNNYSEIEHINVGTGVDLSIRELAELIKGIAGFKGEIAWDRTKPDGTPRKLMDVSKINSLRWKAKIDLKSGLEKTIADYKRENE